MKRMFLYIIILIFCVGIVFLAISNSTNDDGTIFVTNEEGDIVIDSVKTNANNVSINSNCSILSIKWGLNQEYYDEGTLIPLEIVSIGCQGANVKVNLYEYDYFFSDLVVKFEISINSDIDLTKVWVAKFVNDGWFDSSAEFILRIDGSNVETLNYIVVKRSDSEVVVDSLGEIVEFVNKNDVQKCGNKVCEEIESVSSCPQDCGIDKPKKFRFGVEYTIELQNTGIPELYSAMGSDYSKIPEVNWGNIEPNKPVNGIHNYDWTNLDKIVKEYQKNGFDLQMILFSALCKTGNEGICWAIEQAPTDNEWNPSTPPRDGHWEDYQLWVQAVVERYDYDGNNDMPGLQKPILGYEIGNEVCHDGFWQVPEGKSRIEEYKKLLSSAHTAAKLANLDAKIILGGISFLSFFDDFPNDIEVEKRFKDLFVVDPIRKEVMNFTFETLKETDFYDLIDCHYNYDYKGYYRTVDWIRKYSSKPIWAGDTVIGPLLAPGSRLPEINSYKNGFQILTILNTPSNPNYKQIEKWSMTEQSMQGFKKYIVGMDLGLEGANLGNTFDWPGYPLPDYYKQGMADANFVTKKIGAPRPVYYSVKQLIDKLKDYSDVERLNINGNVLENRGKGVWAFKFIVNNKPIYVLWYDSGVYECPICDIKEHGNVIVDLSSYISDSHVKIRYVVTDLDKSKNPIYSSEIVPTNSIQIGESPIFIETGVELDDTHIYHWVSNSKDTNGTGD